MRIMKVAGTILPYRWTLLVCILAGVYAIAVMTYIFIETQTPEGARDFHQFWYAGQFIIQGRDPYEAFFAGEQPALPIAYLDGVVVDRYPVGQPDLEITPSNTPAMLLLLSPLAYLSWANAKLAFLFINILLMLLTAILIVRRIPFADVKLSPIDEIFIFLIYIDLSATRIAIENGQTTLLVFLLMLVTVLYAQRDWRISGLALGLALSKYSLSLPIFLFLLFKKKFRILLAAVSVQILGILGIAAITGTSPLTIVLENIQLFFRLFDQPGIHLSRWFEGISGNLISSMLPVLIMTLAVFVPIYFWLRSRQVPSNMQDVIDFHLLTILFIWTMLVAYHRLYDTLILIIFVVLVYKGLTIPSLWSLSKSERGLLLGYLAVLPLVLILPARLVDRFWLGYYGAAGDAATTLVLLIMLSISIFLLGRSMRSLPQP
jgi:hypothetical protein